MAGGRQKYNAKRTPCNQGHVHASKREAHRCDQLALLYRARQIDGLVVEPFYPFVINGVALKHDNGRRLGYKPDFAYLEGNRTVAEDVKSRATVTEAFVLRSLIFRALYPDIELRVLT